MKARSMAVVAILAVLVAPVFAQDQAELIQKLKDNPNDVSVIQAYGNAVFSKATALSRSDPDKALEILKEFDASLEALSPDDEKAKNLLNSAKSFSGRLKKQFTLQKTSIEDLIKKLDENPKDVETISLYGDRVSMEAGPLARSEPEKAEAVLEKAKELLAKIREKAKDEEDVVKAIDRVEMSFGRLESSIAAAKKLVALIGQDAAPFQADAWVNGTPLTDADLKGKVVLLDFWAVWCGPCIATFPHLRDWRDEYADKGLVIIGVTNYYKRVWDEEAGRAVAPKEGEEATPEAEQEMLKKFAEHHDLHHRFAVQTDRTLSEYYGVTGIPHAVVIDQSGKIRSIKVGSGPANAKAIGDLLKELLTAE